MIKKVLISIILTFLSSSCADVRELPTIKEFDIRKYSGLWYEIARLPNSFEKGLICVTASYTIKENGKIQVLNKGYLADNREKFREAKGKAWIPDSNFPARLKVQFFWPFAGDYYIIDLDTNYKYALVGDPSRKYLWILSRSKSLDEGIYEKLLEKAESEGFNIKEIIKTDQDCEAD